MCVKPLQTASPLIKYGPLTQILAYLTAHSHPEMKRQLPTTVIDQIRLWEVEKNRLVSHQGFLYQLFASAEEYRQVLKYAQDMGYCIWSDDKQSMLFVSQLGHEHVKSYIKQKSS